MVLGRLRPRRKRKGQSLLVDFHINVKQINPWVPSMSQKLVEAVWLQWEHGDKNTGFFTVNVMEGKIDFNESFTVPITLINEQSGKGPSAGPDIFRKTNLEFHLYDSRKDKPMKGHHLGSAIINLADYGNIEETVDVDAPIILRKSSKSVVPPVLYLMMERVVKGSCNSSPKGGRGKGASMDMDSDLVSDEEDGASGTDDDAVPAQSSKPASYFSFETAKNMLHKRKGSRTKETINVEQSPAQTKASISNSDENTAVEPLKQDRVEKESKKTVNTEPVVSSEQNPVAKPNKPQSSKAVIDNPDKSSSTESFEFQINSKEQNITESARDSTNRANVEPRAAIKQALTITESAPVEPAPTSGKKGVNSVRRVVLEPKADIPDDSSSGSLSPIVIEVDGTKNEFTNGKVELESKIEMLEEELREAAAMEVALYSVVAEHGNSVSKVHAPARRLSRFYFHACKGRSRSERASASRTSISGLILVSKACGNDVPRLTFWLSNAIVLRATISQGSTDMPGSYESDVDNSSSHKGKDDAKELFEDWGSMQTFISELEKVEAWIFSRIVESVWWQALTPHMQPAAAKNSKKAYGKKYAFGDPEQVNFSLDLWKSAFKDARERLCPLRAVGLECGCLSMPGRLVMEQLVNRLDVAMFNAILRDSDEDMPTDPMSDPITDSNVLPVPAGKTSFGAGAQLKSCIGEWSRWLTDLFGIDEDHSESPSEPVPHFKPFYLLNSLCDLLMLPFNMISDEPTRQEVCPNFSTALVRTVFTNFVPDEFCSDSVPESVFQALDAEDLPEADYITSVPCNAAPILYSPPRATSLARIIEVGNDSPSARRGKILKKSYTSDDELDELDSPLKSISIDNILPNPIAPTLDMPKRKGPKAVRYQLLREVWKDEN